MSEWARQDAGWYTLGSDVAVCREADGYWHTYVERDAPLGDTKHRTLRAAMKRAERLARAKEARRDRR